MTESNESTESAPQEKKSFGTRIIIFAILAVAIFFYIKAIAPIEEKTASSDAHTSSVEDIKAVQAEPSETAMEEKETVVASAGEADPQGTSDMDEKESAPAEEPQPVQSRKDESTTTPAMVVIKPLPESQMQRIKEVFAPELLSEK